VWFVNFAIRKFVNFLRILKGGSDSVLAVEFQLTSFRRGDCQKLGVVSVLGYSANLPVATGIMLRVESGLAAFNNAGGGR
jgi:hypothetical protein